jgi:hypothetical protein
MRIQAGAVITITGIVATVITIVNGMVIATDHSFGNSYLDGPVCAPGRFFEGLAGSLARRRANAGTPRL